MKFRRFSSLGLAVVLTAIAASSAYGSGSPNKYQKAIDYLKSPARVQRFNPFTTKVGLVLAEALEAGKFGPVERYNDYKKPLQSSYVGWGGIESTNRVAFVWVFWRHGVIDFSKPITQVGIEARNKPSTQVLVFSPSNPEPFWTVSVGYYNMESTSIDAIQDPGLGLDKPIKHGKYTYSFTASLKQIKQLDARALSLLNSDMTSQFGKAWTG